jgi:hypothetical protein
LVGSPLGELGALTSPYGLVLLLVELPLTLELPMLFGGML